MFRGFVSSLCISIFSLFFIFLMFCHLLCLCFVHNSFCLNLHFFCFFLFFFPSLYSFSPFSFFLRLLVVDLILQKKKKKNFNSKSKRRRGACGWQVKNCWYKRWNKIKELSKGCMFMFYSLASWNERRNVGVSVQIIFLRQEFFNCKGFV